MGKKIQKVIDAVGRKRQSYLSKGARCIPRLVIYMDYEYWADCVNEIDGQVPIGEYEFVSKNTIEGCPVWRVVPSQGCPLPPSFIVVALNET